MSSACLAGSTTSLGTDTGFTLCDFPTSVYKFVTKACILGSFNSTGLNTAMFSSSSAIISTVAGIPYTGKAKRSDGDSLIATLSYISHPWGVAVDYSNNLYFTENGFDFRVVNFNSGILTTLGGNYSYVDSYNSSVSTAVYPGDGVLPLNPMLTMNSNNLFYDSSLNYLYFSDEYFHAIRRIDLNTNMVSTVAGGLYNVFQSKSKTWLTNGNYSGDGGFANLAYLNAPSAITIDIANQLLYFCDTSNNMIRKVNLNTGIISPFAGYYSCCDYTGSPLGGFSGDGGFSTSAQLNHPIGVAFDKGNNLVYIVDNGNHLGNLIFPFIVNK